MSSEGSAGGEARDCRITGREWLLLLLLAAVQLTHIVDFMLVMPLGPVYMREMGLSPGQFATVVSAYTVAAGLAGLVAARFLDHFGRKSALLTMYAGFAVGTLLCAIAADYATLLAARTVTGAFGGVAASLVLAVVGDAFHDSRRGTATGVVMSAFSVGSIAGVPLGLLLAEHFGWQVPFLALGGLSLGVLALALLVMPPFCEHLSQAHAHAGYWEVLSNPNHLRAFALMVSLVFTTFSIVPFLATYLVTNVGLRQDELKFMYLCGGLVTIVTLTWVGRLSDRHGKLRVYRLIALVTLAPIVLVTNLPAGTSVPLVLLLTTILMVTTSGRMVPAMALITASSLPRQRGSFMSLNAAVQHLSSGLAAAIGGMMLSEGRDGSLEGYPLVGLLASLAALASIFLAGRLRPASETPPELASVAAIAEEVGPLGAVAVAGLALSEQE